MSNDRMTVSRMTAMIGRNRDIEAILDGLAVAYSLRLTHWAKAIAARVDYRGAWTFGVAATRLEGLKSFHAYDSWAHREDYDPYDRDCYEETTAHTSELESDAAAVAERLIGGLLRGLASDPRYAAHFGGTSS